jgi:DNA invertase Pin-like site-specific DNA recombinase
VSIKCQCGRERDVVKADVIKLIEGGSKVCDIVRILGCSRQYVHHLQREIAIVHATAAQLRLTFTSPSQVHDRN